MAVVFDACSSNNSLIGSSTTYSFTVGAGANNIVMVMLVTITGDPAITSVTYAGAAMTLILGPVNTNSGESIYLYYKMGASTGANNVVATFASAVSGGDTRAISYTGVLGFPDASHSVIGNSVSSLACTVTTVNDNCLVVAACRNAASNSSSAGAGTTLRTNSDGANSVAWAEANSATHPAGATTVNYNYGATGDGALLGVSMSPTALTTTNSAFFMAAN